MPADYRKFSRRLRRHSIVFCEYLRIDQRSSAGNL